MQKKKLAMETGNEATFYQLVMRLASKSYEYGANIIFIIHELGMIFMPTQQC